MKISIERFRRIDAEIAGIQQIQIQNGVKDNTPFMDALINFNEQAHEKGGIASIFIKKQDQILRKTAATNPKQAGAFFSHPVLDQNGNKILDQNGAPRTYIDLTPTPESADERQKLIEELLEQEYDIEENIQFEIPVLNKWQIKAFEGIFIPIGYKNPEKQSTNIEIPTELKQEDQSDSDSDSENELNDITK